MAKVLFGFAVAVSIILFGPQVGHLLDVGVFAFPRPRRRRKPLVEKI